MCVEEATYTPVNRRFNASTTEIKGGILAAFKLKRSSPWWEKSKGDPDFYTDKSFNRWFPTKQDLSNYMDFWHKDVELLYPLNAWKNSTQSRVDTTAASGQNKEESNKMSNMFNNQSGVGSVGGSTSGFATPKSAVKVQKVAPPPAPVPPPTYTLTFEGLSSREVAQLRKVLENTEGVEVAKTVASQIRSQTGDTGDFYSYLVVSQRGKFYSK